MNQVLLPLTVLRYFLSLFPLDASFIEGASDPSDRTLIRVLRSEFEEEEKGRAPLKPRKARKVEQHFPPLKKRASEEEGACVVVVISKLFIYRVVGVKNHCG